MLEVKVVTAALFCPLLLSSVCASMEALLASLSDATSDPAVFVGSLSEYLSGGQADLGALARALSNPTHDVIDRLAAVDWDLLSLLFDNIIQRDEYEDQAFDYARTIVQTVADAGSARDLFLLMTQLLTEHRSAHTQAWQLMVRTYGRIMKRNQRLSVRALRDGVRAIIWRVGEELSAFDGAVHDDDGKTSRLLIPLRMQWVKRRRRLSFQ